MFSVTAFEGALAIGAIRTGFLRHKVEASEETASALLALIPGEQVRHAHRPRAYAVSPETLTGVDCDMPSRNGRRIRGIGTVATRATLTGGRILQTCSYTTLVPASRGYRRDWSHYLGRPGVVEVLGRLNVDDAAAGFAEAERGSRGIELGLIAESTMNRVQASQLLDGHQPLRAPRGSWRWALQGHEPGERELFRFTILRDDTRLVRMAVAEASIADLLDLIEDLALHDWLLTTVESQLERAQLGSGPISGKLQTIRPLIDHVLHHWMPHARVRQDLIPLWDGLNRMYGLTRQWNVSTDRLRDQLLLANALMLSGSYPDTKESSLWR